jgi:hypothetical protein
MPVRCDGAGSVLEPGGCGGAFLVPGIRLGSGWLAMLKIVLGANERHRESPLYCRSGCRRTVAAFRGWPRRSPSYVVSSETRIVREFLP